MEERLQKILSAAGICSRRASEAYLTAGRVTVNGEAAQLGQRADPETDVICVDGVPVKTTPKPIYVMLNKPRGYVTTVSDEQGRKTVMDLLRGIAGRIYPVGRLDMDSEGLLLLTNDGDLTYKLTHPKHDVEKTYIAKLYGVPDEGALQKFRRGVVIDGRKTKPAKIQILEREKDGRFCTAEIVIHEGRNRQVRKMCESIKHPVAQLQRVATGELTLGELPKGKYRHLTEKEIRYLKRL